MNGIQHLTVFSLFFLSLILVFEPHYQAIAADPIVETIEKALKQYSHGDYAGAASNLEYASQLVRDKKNQRMQALLPEPLPGWQGGEISTQTLGSTILGGGITVSRDYSKEASKITVEVVADSPVLESVMIMMKNPMLLSVGGGKLEALTHQKAFVNYDKAEQGGEIYIVVDGGFLISLKGKNVTRAEMLALADNIDYSQFQQNPAS